VSGARRATSRAAIAFGLARQSRHAEGRYDRLIYRVRSRPHYRASILREAHMLSELEIFSDALSSTVFLYGSAALLVISAVVALWMRHPDKKPAMPAARHRRSAHSV
jgi:hypothetical protein